MAEPYPIEDVLAACKTPPDFSKDFYLHHVNFRIKDPKRTIEFYTGTLGMRLVCVLPMTSFKSTLYCVGYSEEPIENPADGSNIEKWIMKKDATIEFLHHWGSEDLPSDRPYCDGNEKVGRGYSHLCVRVPDPLALQEILLKQGVEFVWKSDEGTATGPGFFRDPDGYWVEILGTSITPNPGGKDPQEFKDKFNLP